MNCRQEYVRAEWNNADSQFLLCFPNPQIPLHPCCGTIGISDEVDVHQPRRYVEDVSEEMEMGNPICRLIYAPFPICSLAYAKPRLRLRNRRINFLYRAICCSFTSASTNLGYMAFRFDQDNPTREVFDCERIPHRTSVRPKATQFFAMVQEPESFEECLVAILSIKIGTHRRHPAKRNVHLQCL
jgi:hypothetical protein